MLLAELSTTATSTFQPIVIVTLQKCGLHMSEVCLKILSRMTKTKDFIATLPQAASARDQKAKGQSKGRIGQAPKQELLEPVDSDDSGDSPVFTTIDSLPPNKVRNYNRFK